MLEAFLKADLTIANAIPSILDQAKALFAGLEEIKSQKAQEWALFGPDAELEFRESDKNLMVRAESRKTESTAPQV